VYPSVCHVPLLQLFLYEKNLCTLFDRANTCLQHMSKWFIDNRRSLNVDKTCFCVFSNERKNHPDFQLKVNGKNISRVDSCKYLGIIIDCNLSWKELAECQTNDMLSHLCVQNVITQ